MMIRKLLVCLFLSAICCQAVFAQGTAIRGRVVDTVSEAPLAGVSVTIVGEAGGAATDDNGYFSLRTNRKGNQVVSVNFMGFEPKRISININDSETDLGTIVLGSETTAYYG